MEIPRALVRSRVTSPLGGGQVALLDVIEDLLDGAHRGIVALRGPPGSGKTTALHQLATYFPDREQVALYDADDTAPGPSGDDRRLVVVAATSPWPEASLELRLAPWDEDDFIEYLLATHPADCARVLNELRTDLGRSLLGDSPELWAPVLDRLASHPGLGVRNALHAHLDEMLGDDDARRSLVDQAILPWLLPAHTEPEQAQAWIATHQPQALRWLRHRGVRVALGALRLARRIEHGDAEPLLQPRLPRDLMLELSALIARSHRADAVLRHTIVTTPWAPHGAIASLLHQADPAWHPGDWLEARLEGAELARIQWADADLRRARLDHAIFDGACLNGADLSAARGLLVRLDRASLVEANLAQARMPRASLIEADLTHANLDGASLPGARMLRCRLGNASLVGADLSRAILSGSDLANADLSLANLADARVDGASFEGAILAGTDLSGVRLREAALEGARMHGALLQRADLAGLEARDLDLESARMDDAKLTDARLSGARLLRASLRGAWLAGVDLQGADLREVDFSYATFHRESPRAGLPDPSIKSEGDRGIRNDDRVVPVRPPEAIRTANLRAADLRGALVLEADFYRVDLRGARMTDDQLDHFLACRAILDATA